MAILSKEIFDRNFTNQTPCSFLHPWSDKCSDGLKVLVVNTLIGTSKFFLPIYIIKIILDWKNISMKTIKWHIIGYLRTIMYGITFGVLLSGTMCLTAKIKLSYYNVLMSGLVAGLSILVESRQNQILDGLLFFSQVLESGLNILTQKKYLKRTRGRETIAFMFISSYVMYLLKKYYPPKKFIYLWFYRTSNVLDNYEVTPELPCTHEFTCKLHAYKGAFRYFFAGYAIEFVKNVVPRLGRLLTKPRELPSMIFNRKSILFGIFFASYAFLYRTITCHLLKNDREESPNHALVAGFIAGSAYYIQPNIHCPIFGVTTVLQLLWRRLRRNTNLPNFIPYSVIMFCFSTAVLMHMKFHVHDYCPKYTKNMLSVVTNKIADKIYDNLWNILKESDKLLA